MTIDMIIDDLGFDIVSLDYEKNVKWFREVYHEIMRNEGWIIDMAFIDDELFCVIKSDASYTNYKTIISNKLAYKRASRYGWVLNKNGVILRYDPNKHIKNKHLATGNELGLI